MNDWVVWPIYVVQLISLLIVLCLPNITIRGVSLRSIVVGFLVLVVAGVLISLYHDSTDVLGLHF